MKMTRDALRIAGFAVLCGSLVGVGLLLSQFLARDNLLTDAFGPIAVLSEPNPDDSAGDALVPDDNGERFLPVPAPFDDERVVAALAPIATLSCHRNDSVESKSADDTAGESTDTALDAPLASQSPEAQAAATEPLLAAAVAPLAAVSAPRPANDAQTAAAPAADMPADCPALLRYQFNRLQTGESQSLCQFQGKVLLIVNTASYCGYTGQYEGLEALYRKYKGRGLVVVGFPSNDFGGQEPGTNQEIAKFCRLTYGVQFPMFEKSSVTKVSANPLFATLAASTGTAPQWNFYKYVVDRKGQPVAGYGSRTTPDNPELIRLIERLLADRPQG